LSLYLEFRYCCVN